MVEQALQGKVRDCLLEIVYAVMFWFSMWLLIRVGRNLILELSPEAAPVRRLHLLVYVVVHDDPAVHQPTVVRVLPDGQQPAVKNQVILIISIIIITNIIVIVILIIIITVVTCRASSSGRWPGTGTR